MRDHPLYKNLRQIALDGDYTVAKIKRATKEQVAELLALDVDAAFWSGGNIGFFENLKLNLAQELQEMDNAADEQTLKGLLKAMFPDAVIERDHSERDPCVKVFYKGKS